MILSRWDEGSDSDQVTGLRNQGLVGHRKILALQLARLPRYGRDGRLRFDRSLPKRGYEPLRRKGSQVKQ
jgi:hypothetical protein